MPGGPLGSGAALLSLGRGSLFQNSLSGEDAALCRLLLGCQKLQGLLVLWQDKEQFLQRYPWESQRDQSGDFSKVQRHFQ